MNAADHHQVDDVAQGKHQTGGNGGKEDLADRNLRIAAHRHQHDGGRDQNTQRTAGAHHAAGQRGLVAAAKQHRQGQHTHGDHGCAHDTGGGGEHSGNQNDGQTQTALQGAKKVTDGLKQAICHLGMGQEVCHQHEHGDCHHGVALHLVVNFGHGDGNAGAAPSQPADDDTGAAQHEGQFLTQHQAHNHQAEQGDDHDDRHLISENTGRGDPRLKLLHNCRHYWASFPSAGSVFFPCASSTMA